MVSKRRIRESFDTWGADVLVASEQRSMYRTEMDCCQGSSWTHPLAAIASRV